MFEYDSFYDFLFADFAFLENLYNFHSSRWKKFNRDQRYKVIDDFIKRYCAVFHIGKMKVRKETSDRNSGSYIDIISLVNINKDSIINGNSYDVLDTLFHELRHNFQRRATSNNLISIESASEEQISKWKINFFCSPRGYSNYISYSGENGSLYKFQPVEEDAFKTGLSLTRKSYELMRNVLGEDDEFLAYCHLNKEVIMTYFSDEDKYAFAREKLTKKVFEIFKENNKEFEIEKKCLSVAKETMKKDVSTLTLEEIYSLFSVYVWGFLDDDKKLDLLIEYDKRVNKYRETKIQKYGNSAFQVANEMANRNDIFDILNIMFSYQYMRYCNGIISGEEECDERLREQLRINRYKHDDKLINYISDEESLLLYSIQPYALLEAKIIGDKFKTIKETETKFYGIDEGNYDKMIRFYDNNKYKDFIEKFYGKSFDKIYNKMMENMKKNIKKVEKQRK